VGLLTWPARVTCQDGRLALEDVTKILSESEERASFSLLAGMMGGAKVDVGD
jgi:hypothetical protein